MLKKLNKQAELLTLVANAVGVKLEDDQWTEISGNFGKPLLTDGNNSIRYYMFVLVEDFQEWVFAYWLAYSDIIGIK